MKVTLSVVQTMNLSERDVANDLFFSVLEIVIVESHHMRESVLPGGIESGYAGPCQVRLKQAVTQDIRNEIAACAVFDNG